MDTKSGRTVTEILRENHPDPFKPDPKHFHSYSSVPELETMTIDREVVEKVSHTLSGSTGLGGTDSTCLQQWLSCYKSSSRSLQESIGEFMEWIANTDVPWAAYRALWAGRLIAIDKLPGVRPIGIGETWRRMMAKNVMNMAGHEETKACKTTQLCAGLPSGIEGGIHSIMKLREEHAEEENWAFLMIDAKMHLIR